MGDPETEVVVPIKTDLVELFWLLPMKLGIKIDERSAVMVVSGGYLKSMKRKSDFWTRKITDSIVFMRVRNYRTGLLSVTEEVCNLLW
jgi:hypothetical protein